MPTGKVLAFAATGERRCLGVWRGGRWIVCPYAAVIDGAAARDQCAACARLDRSRSVAADTMADDPRPYGLYLAYFGPGLLKVGITAAARGPARLVEHGAVAYAWLGRGPLMAARRAEALLGSALGVPDRFAKAAKRAARGALPPVAERRAELARLHARARELDGWPETLTPVDFAFGDHSGVFGLDRIPPGAGELGAMTAGAEIVGEVLAGVGPDVYLRLRVPGDIGGGEGGEAVAVLDARWLSGWVLAPAGGRVTTVPVREVPYGEGRAEADGGGQEGLF
ncbi:DUF2797 domain-containing protein [Streptomyces sp. SF28]|nr:DUF2797 domain-containing protein [Streptomyces pinistramenti]MCB5910813.1 DUF2797 domain-containing protein [Streptomyces pinistramenti]